MGALAAASEREEMDAQTSKQSMIPGIPNQISARPNETFKAGLLRKGVAWAATLALGGCVLAPGPYMGVAPREDTTTQADGQSAPAEIVQNGITFRLHALNGEMIAQLAAAAAAPFAPSALPRVVPSAYRVRSGDVLRVIVWDHPELNNPGFSALTTSIVSVGATQSTGMPAATSGGNLDPNGRVVQTDGTIYYPYIGRVKVAGLTVDQIRQDIFKRLDKAVSNPQVDVSIASYRSQKIYVSGAVHTPGTISLTDVPESVSDAISGAGGYSQGADLSAATLNRGGKVYPLDLYAFFYDGDVSQNVMLEDGDVINLPERRLKKVFVLGEVNKPVSQIMPVGPFSLSEALSDAGGLNGISANASQVYVFRQGPGRTVDVFQLDAASPGMLVLGDRFELQPRDVVFVDAAHVTRFYRVVSQILPFASSLYLGTEAFK